MDTKEVVARFESERQALALMDHPAIAKVFDGGSTPGGPAVLRDGVRRTASRSPSTATSTSSRTAERLELLVRGLRGRPARAPEGHHPPRPQAVEHPGRRLVDGKAAAEDHRLRNRQGDRAAARPSKTLFTELGAVIGTPEYMSPEQADSDRPGRRHPDRRLLAGRRALPAADRGAALPTKELRSLELRGAAAHAPRDEPPRPSTRLATLGDARRTSPRSRKTDPGALRRQLRGRPRRDHPQGAGEGTGRRYGTPPSSRPTSPGVLPTSPSAREHPARAIASGSTCDATGSGSRLARRWSVLLLAFAGTMGLQARRIARERDSSQCRA